MQAMGSDKRRHERVEIARPLKVIDTMSNQSLGLVVNISLEGLMLIGEKAVVDGAVYQVELPVNNGDETLKLGIECLWSSEADSENKNWSGYRVIDICDEDKAALNSLIDQI